VTHTKICASCGKNSETSLFHKNSRTKDGLERRCKLCRKEIASGAYKENWFAYTCKLKKYYCGKNNIDFNLTEEYLKSIWTETCPVFKVKFVMFSKSDDNSPSLDRIDPLKGYVEGNVCFISARANRIKYNASIQELKQVIDYMKSKG
jgi:hypothetical protein